MARCHGRGSPGCARRRVPPASNSAAGNDNVAAAADGYHRGTGSRVDDERAPTYDYHQHHNVSAPVGVDLHHDAGHNHPAGVDDDLDNIHDHDVTDHVNDRTPTTAATRYDNHVDHDYDTRTEPWVTPPETSRW